jgi:hypothetical protein
MHTIEEAHFPGLTIKMGGVNKDNPGGVERRGFVDNRFGVCSGVKQPKALPPGGKAFGDIGPCSIIAAHVIAHSDDEQFFSIFRGEG